MREERFHALLDAAPDGVLVESSSGIAYVNSAYATALGYTHACELEGATIRDIAHPAEWSRLATFGSLRREGRPAPARYAFRACTRDGDVVTLDASISAAVVEGELLITTLVRPIASLDLDELSEREREVVELLLAGKRSKEIALMLEVSDKTVFTHRSRAFAKLGVSGIGELFSRAKSAGPL